MDMLARGGVTRDLVGRVRSESRTFTSISPPLFTLLTFSSPLPALQSHLPLLFDSYDPSLRRAVLLAGWFVGRGRGGRWAVWSERVQVQPSLQVDVRSSSFLLRSLIFHPVTRRILMNSTIFSPYPTFSPLTSLPRPFPPRPPSPPPSTPSPFAGVNAVATNATEFAVLSLGKKPSQPTPERRESVER